MSQSDDPRRTDEEAQRRQQREQLEEHERTGILPSPPPYEVPETPLERLDLGLGYMFGVVGAALLLNLAILYVISLGAGG